MDKLALFYETLQQVYPSVAASGTFSRGELDSMKTVHGLSIPAGVWKNRASWGVYAVPREYRINKPGVESEAATESPAIPIPRKSPTVIAEPMKPPVHHLPPPPVAKGYIPERDPEFVPFGVYKEIETVIGTGIFYPAYITGLSGNGKSSMVEQICSKKKRSLIRVNLNAMSDEDQLIGTKTLVDGNVEIVEGPVLIAMRTGSILLIDEIDAGSANSLLCLQPILEGKPYYFKLKNEMIHPAPGFNVVATANTKGQGNDNGQFIGTNILNEAFLERFGVTLEQPYPTAAIEQKIIINHMRKHNCLDEGFASVLAKWSDAIRRTYDAGGCEETMSTRRLIHIVTAYSIFRNKNKAVELCCNRFDSQTKEAFKKMFDAISPEEPTQENPDPKGASVLDQVQAMGTLLGTKAVMSYTAVP